MDDIKRILAQHPERAAYEFGITLSRHYGIRSTVEATERGYLVRADDEHTVEFVLEDMQEQSWDAVEMP